LKSVPPATRGAWAEQHAARYLAAAGLHELERNYRCAGGEIDLIMEEGGVLVFVEVRYRRHERHGTAAESVHTLKRQRLLHSAQHYLLTHTPRERQPCRFDVITLSGAAPVLRVEWIKNAFQA